MSVPPPENSGESIAGIDARTAAGELADGILDIAEEASVMCIRSTDQPFPKDNEIHIFTRRRQDDGTPLLSYEVLDSLYAVSGPVKLLLDTPEGFFIVPDYLAAKSGNSVIDSQPIADDDPEIELLAGLLTEAIASARKNILPAGQGDIDRCAAYLQLFNELIPEGVVFDIEVLLSEMTPDAEGVMQYTAKPYTITSTEERQPDGSLTRGVCVQYRTDEIVSDDSIIPTIRQIGLLQTGDPQRLFTLRAHDSLVVPSESTDVIERLSPPPRPIDAHEVGRLLRVFSSINSRTEVVVDSSEDPIALGKLLSGFNDGLEHELQAMLSAEKGATTGEIKDLIKFAQDYLAKANGAESSPGLKTYDNEGSRDALSVSIHQPATISNEQTVPPAGELTLHEFNFRDQSGPAQLTITEFIPGTLQICVDWAQSSKNDGPGATLIIRTDGNFMYEFYCPQLPWDELPELPKVVTPEMYKVCSMRFAPACHDLLFNAMQVAKKDTVNSLAEFLQRH